MSIKVKVLFFDRRSGEGMVKCLTSGHTAEIYACNLPFKRTWYAATACVYYEEGAIVEVKQDPDSGMLIGLTTPKYDREKWESLDHSRLAFKCNIEGKAINGLFA